MSLQMPFKYFNRFDPAKNYKKLLFLSGQGLQAAELNEVQDTILNELKSLGSFLLPNGTILNGGEVEVITANSIDIKAATVYADGISIAVTARSVPITAVGVELIGMSVLSTLVSDLDDPVIREPDPESPNYGQPGSYRLAQNGVWKKSTEVGGDEAFFPILTLNDGKLVSSSSSTDSSGQINTLIGKYDYETNGNYVVSGIVPSYDSIDPETDKVLLNVSSGKARILGQPIAVSFLQQIELDAINDLRTVLSEPYVYSGSKVYPLRYAPIAEIIQVQGIKRITSTIIHGSYSGIADLLPETPVLAIESVVQASTTYVAGVDYISNGDFVDWSPTGSEPSPGSTYQVTYTYVDMFSASFNTGGTGVILDANNLLVTGSTFFVDYKFYLKRFDRISLDSKGQFIISKGTPGYLNYDKPQYVANALSIAIVELIKYQDPKISLDTVTNISMSELQSIKKTMSNMEVNIAKLSLLENARSTDSFTTKRNLVVDPLYDNDMRDNGASNNLLLEDKKLKIGSNLVLGKATTVGISLPYVSEIALSQPRITGSTKINPYASPTAPNVADLIVEPSAVKLEEMVRWSWYHLWYNFWSDKRNVKFNVILSKFSPNEAITITFNKQTYTATANALGEVTKEITFTVPIKSITASSNLDKNNYSESYDVKAKGNSSGIEATGRFTTLVAYVGGSGYRFWWGGQWWPWGYDPVAETVLFTTNTDITVFAYYCTELPQDDIIVKIVNCKLGIPDRTEVVGSARQSRASVVAGLNYIYFSTPVHLDKDSEYAFIINTSKAVGSVGIAKVGQFDNIAKVWVNTQPTDGVFLASANESTWTPIQDQDLTFHLYKAKYQTTLTTTVLTLTNLSNITDWYLTGDAIIPTGTSVNLYLQDSIGTTYDINIDSKIYTPALSGTVFLKAKLTTTNTSMSPILAKGLSLYIGTPEKPGFYTMRTFDITNGSTTPATIKLIIDVYSPSGSSVIPSIETATGVYTQMTSVSSSPIGDNWYEAIYQIDNIARNTSKLQIVADSSVATARPEIKNIRILIS